MTPTNSLGHMETGPQLGCICWTGEVRDQTCNHWFESFLCPNFEEVEGGILLLACHPPVCVSVTKNNLELFIIKK